MYGTGCSFEPSIVPLLRTFGNLLMLATLVLASCKRPKCLTVPSRCCSRWPFPPPFLSEKARLIAVPPLSESETYSWHPDTSPD
jgi:hypothetical protein